MGPVFSFWQRTDRHAVAVIDPDGREVTVGALQVTSSRIARSLRALGLRPGDVVAFVLPNGVEVYELWLAATQVGLYVVPINRHLAPPEVAYVLQDSGARVVVADAAHAALVGEGPWERFAVGKVDGWRAYEALRTLGGDDSGPPDDRLAGGVMNYTSGTTGRPKGVRRPLPQVAPEPVFTGFASFLLLFGMTPGHGVQLVGSPLYHTAVLYFSQSALHLGHTLVLMDRFTPEGFLAAVERHGVTSAHMVPTQLVRLLACDERERFDVSSLRHVVHSAAPCPVTVKQRILDWWGDCVWEYYAATEGGGTVVGPADWRARPGTVGRPWAGADVRVLDDDGQPCASRQVGTVWIRMPQTFEYHNDRARTEQAWHEGYFTVGDAGWMDEEGWLYLSDRKADLIIRGGVNIYPAEIEAVLVTHPSVLDVAVFGVPDDDLGEQVMAVIEPRAGVAADPALADDILAFARERLGRFKVPRTVAFTPALPRDPNGKLAKRKLRDPYWAGVGRAI